jgi:hypothetical protein
VHVFDAHGRRVRQLYMALAPGESGQFIPVSDLSSGVYQVVLDAPEAGLLVKGKLVVAR